MGHQKKREKTTFVEVVGFAVVFLIADVALAWLGWSALLVALGTLQIFVLGVLVVRAILDSLPKGIQKELKKL